MNREKLKGRRAVFAWVQSLDSFFRQARLRYLGLGLLIAWVYGVVVLERHLHAR